MKATDHLRQCPNCLAMWDNEEITAARCRDCGWAWDEDHPFAQPHNGRHILRSLLVWVALGFLAAYGLLWAIATIVSRSIHD
jgi:hypothetical protein